MYSCFLVLLLTHSLLLYVLQHQADHRAIKDGRLKRAIMEVIDKGEVPLPDRMFTKDVTLGSSLTDGALLKLDYEEASLEKKVGGSYLVRGATPGNGKTPDEAGYKPSYGFELEFAPAKAAVRHGDNGVVAGHDGDDMFYYFIPRMKVTGSLTIGPTTHKVAKADGWYDHEFGGKKPEGGEGLGEAAAAAAAAGEAEEGGAGAAAGGGAAAAAAGEGEGEPAAKGKKGKKGKKGSKGAASAAAAEAADAMDAAAVAEDDPSKRGKMEYAWNWAAVQLDNNVEVSVAVLIDPRDGRLMQTSAVVIAADGSSTQYEEMTFEKQEGEEEWTSVRTFISFPTHWKISIPGAALELSLVATFADQEFVTVIARPSFWEGRCEVTGSMGGAAVAGHAFIERNGFSTLSSLNGFFKNVGIRVRKSVEDCYPSNPSFEEARDLIATPETNHYMDGIPLDKFVETVINPVRLIADRGGKSWRSYGALACCDVVGGDSRLFVDWLALPEFMHVGSLIVDDIQDDSKTRRGGPCAHLVHGMPLALNAGTAAYFQATSLIKKPKTMTHAQMNQIYELYFAALRGGHAGQALDIYGLDYLMDEAVPAGNGALLEERILGIHRLKTAVPAGTLARMGAIVGGGSDEQVEAVGRYYEAVGVAFQIMDDVLNLRGLYTNPADAKPNQLMKTLGEDIIDGKITMPVCKAIGIMSLADREKLWAVVKSKPDDQKIVDGVIADLERVGAIQACVDQSIELVEEAWEDLDKHIPSSFAKIMLRSFGWYVTDRAH